MFDGILKWLALVVVIWLLYQYVNRQQQLAYQAARRGGFSFSNASGDLSVQF